MPVEEAKGGKGHCVLSKITTVQCPLQREAPETPLERRFFGCSTNRNRDHRSLTRTSLFALYLFSLHSARQLPAAAAAGVVVVIRQLKINNNGVQKNKKKI